VTTGLHPWYGKGTGNGDFHTIEEAANDGRIIAVGECGIDRRKGMLNIEKQIQIFERHLQIAETYELPVIIHCVRAVADILSLRRTYNKTPWLIHGFFGNEQEIAQCMRHGVRLSPGIALMIHMGLDSHKLLERIRLIETDMLYLETDGVEIEIREIYAIAEESTGIEKEALAEIIRNNAIRDFGVDITKR
jgi:TatD DNase family protein